MRMTIALVMAGALAACSGAKHKQEAESGKSPTAASKTKASKTSASKKPVVADSVAHFAGGCFWGVEHYLEKMDGVASVESGYMGGKTESPTYEQVSSKGSGHIETVRVRYDSKRSSYYDIAKRFFEIHDPTQANGQGPDIGPQYISAVFYASPAERKSAEGLISELEKRGFKVVTKLLAAVRFWPAEEYHQNYYARTGKAPYCHTRVRRFDKPLVN